MFPESNPRSRIQLFVCGSAALLALSATPAGHRVATTSRPSGIEDNLGAKVCAAGAVKDDALSAEARFAGADESWWQTVSTEIARAEYEPKATAAGLQAPNRAHDLRTTFGAGGIEVTPRTSKDVVPAWHFSWETSGIGRTGSLQDVVAVSPESSGERVTYNHDGWSEWYVNTAAGLEQGFTLERRPAGDGPLRIAGKVPETLEAQVRDDGAIDFIESHGTCAIRYGELHVWDAEGVELCSELVVTGTELAIVIDDQNAEYPIIVDPLMTSPAWTAESNQASANFGSSVATAGDVNGDGFSDVIVGAHLFDNPTSAEGRAFVYHGSPSGLSLTAAWTAEGNQAGAQLGYSVSTAGDVNGDGFDDVIVGAFSFNNGETDEGKVWVFHGSASGLNPGANWSAEGNQASAVFGISVATAGDVNGDGFSDVIVGAYNFDNGQTDGGGAFVYHGSAGGLSLNANWTAEPDVGDARFGASVSTAGDVNGDGFDDVIVGANLISNGEPNEGKAYVYHGSAGGLSSTANWTRESNLAGAVYGSSVATAGDVNGDGFSDVIVGAHGVSNSEVNEGRAYAYYGSSSGLSVFANWTEESNQPGALFGLSVATAGDVNGDGYGDVIVGSYLHDSGETDEGKAFVFNGSASGLSHTAHWTAESNQTSANFGVAVATAGDVNGDGFSDVIVGAYLFDNGHADEGGAFVYHGSAAGVAVYPAWTVHSEQFTSEFGYSVATAGDVNADGFSDVIVGAFLLNNGQVLHAGAAFVYHGSAAGLGLFPDWTAGGAQVNEWFGTSVATAGDVNGDGFSDVIVGSVQYDNGQMDEGRACVYHGSAAGLGLSPAWTAESDQVEAWFGYSVGEAGDVNGDGYSDVIVGSLYYDNGQTNEGQAFVYHGSSTGLATVAAWTAEGDQNSAFAYSVGTAGDVNGDGFSDVITAALSQNGPVFEGRALVYHGSGSGLAASAAWTAETDRNLEHGRSVGTAGDVNGDGFSDVIVGAFHSTNGGRAFVYHGSAAGLGLSPVWTAESDQLDAFFGYSVGTAEDVNGDGFSDVVVGAQSLDDPGRAFVYHGAALGLGSSPAWTAEGYQDGDSFGVAVAMAGDVNGDGFSDVMVGASGVSSGKGLALVYYGNDGDGIERMARQARTDDSAPICLLGRSDSPSAFRLKTLGRTPAGRGDVRLQAEIKPLGVAFDGTGLVMGLEYNTGAPSGGSSVVPLSEMVNGLSANSLYHWRLRIVSDSPFFPRSPWFSQEGNAPSEADLRTAGGSVAVAETSGVATHLWLEPSAPNPFREQTRFAYTLPERGRVRLAVYDVAGREVAVLAEGVKDVGRHSQAWDGRASRGARLSAGVYFARLEFAGGVEARKIVLTR